MRILLLLLAFLTSSTIFAQSNFWRSANETAIQLTPDQDRGPIPQAYETFSLNMDGLKNYLRNAPMERTPEANTQALNLELPAPDGSINTFKIVESPVMIARDCSSL